MMKHDSLKPYAMQLGLPKSESLWKIFNILYDSPDKRKVAAALPGKVSEVAEKTGLSLADTQEALKALRQKGAVNQIMSKTDSYRLYPELIHLRDSVIITPGVDPVVAELFDAILVKDIPGTVPFMEKMGLPPVMRVLPIEETVESEDTILNIESARQIIQEAEQVVAVPCACRTTAKLRDRNSDCPAPKDVNLCLLTNRFGYEIVDRGIGKLISTQEALRRLDLAEEAGLVHMGRNNVSKDMMICNCCPCCCTGLYIHNVIQWASYAPSRYKAKLDDGLCVGCGECVERCYFQAIDLEEVAHIDTEKCFGCGNCAKVCPANAISLEEVLPMEHIRGT
ncbi:MAG: 4Fe-4S dicluster domain-containing protein [Desulfobacula sp.]|nr:4Fe-4S dicluster domain-containing protein [Desulfobacula sp.]